MTLEREPVAWMIMYKGCEVGPVETMEMTALLKARDTNAEGVVPLFRMVPPDPFKDGGSGTYHNMPLSKFPGARLLLSDMITPHQMALYYRFDHNHRQELTSDYQAKINASGPLYYCVHRGKIKVWPRPK